MSTKNTARTLQRLLCPFEYRTVGTRIGDGPVALPDGRRLSLDEWKEEHPHGVLIQVRIERPNEKSYTH